MAIAQQLQAESTAQSNAGQTVAVTLGAGSNRYMVVALSAEHATAQTAPTSVTYGGNAMALITDGTVTASQITGVAGVFMYRLLEANMPANGANNLVVTWPSTTTYIMGWWILTGVAQTNAHDVKILGQTTTATTITETLDAGATTDAVICAVYKNDTTGTVAITISGAGVTEDFDVSFGSARGAAGTDLPAVASGTIACVATVSSTARRIIAAVRLAEAATVNTSTMALTGVPVAGSGTGTVTPTPGFVAFDNGGTPRSVVVAADVTLLVVAISNSAVDAAVRTVTYNGVTLSVGISGNDWTQIHYMLNPPVGSFTLAVSGANISTIMATTYSGVSSFVSGSQGSVFDHTFSPTAAALACMVMSSGSTATPLGSTTERIDNAGDWYGDAIVGASGSLTVGTTTASSPDSSAALFSSLAGANTSTMALTGVPVEGSGTGVAKLTSTMALTGVPVAGSGTGIARLTSTQALTGVPVAGSGTGVARLASTMALTGVPVAGAGTGIVQLNGTLALTNVPVSGSGTGQAKLTSTMALTAVPVAGSGTGVAQLNGTLALVGVPIAGSGTGVVKLTGTLALTSVPVAGTGSGEAKLTATLALLGVPIEGSGTGAVIPVVTMNLVGVPIEGSGTGVARLASTMALIGAAVAGTGTGIARLLSALALTGVPVQGAGTGAAALQSTLTLTGVPAQGAGTGVAKLASTMTLTGVPIEGSGTGSIPSPAGLNIIGVPVQGSGTGVAKLTSTFQLSGVPVAGSGTGSAKLTAQLDLTGVPVAGSGTGAVRLTGTLALTAVPVSGTGSGQVKLTSTLGLAGVPVAGSGSGVAKLTATMNLVGAAIVGSGTGEGGSTSFTATLELIGVRIAGSGSGIIGLPPKGDTQAQDGLDGSSAGADLDAGHVQIGSAGTIVVSVTDNGVTVVISQGLTNVKVG